MLLIIYYLPPICNCPIYTLSSIQFISMFLTNFLLCFCCIFRFKTVKFFPLFLFILYINKHHFHFYFSIYNKRPLFALFAAVFALLQSRHSFVYFLSLSYNLKMLIVIIYLSIILTYFVIVLLYIRIIINTVKDQLLQGCNNFPAFVNSCLQQKNRQYHTKSVRYCLHYIVVYFYIKRC